MTSSRCLHCSRLAYLLWKTAVLKTCAFLLGATLIVFPALPACGSGSPFDVGIREIPHATSQQVEVTIRVPTDHYIYAESLRVRSEDGDLWHPVQVPEPKTIFDAFAEENKAVYDTDFSGIYEWKGGGRATSVVVELQGCDHHVCFFPEERRFELGGVKVTDAAGSLAAESDTRSSTVGDWRHWADRFRIVGVESGFLGKDEFLAFLDRDISAEAPQEDAFLTRLRQAGPWLGAVMILLGGLALNLTPCVLPMIPVNLTIIGAGARAGSKGRGFLLGATYGMGMAIAYGALGLIAALTGSTFGALNASPWFNAFMAVLFVVLALAAFEVILVDFSRFQRLGGAGAVGVRFGAVFLLGMISALLAGACVAPVVISVLLLTSALYSQGHVLAAALPFLLGLGMALPWPLAGAGLALLPRPGPWMKWVNRAFGIFILALAIYYANTAVRLFRARAEATSIAEVPTDAAAIEQSAENARLAAEMERAYNQRKPVLIDFWATWCKNCTAMEKTTFRDAAVQARMQDFVVIKYQAEQPDSVATKPVLQHFRVGGLPTYVILRRVDM